MNVTRISLIVLAWVATALLLGCAPQTDDVQPTAGTDAARSPIKAETQPPTDGPAGAKTASKAVVARPTTRKPNPPAPTAIAWAKDWSSAQKTAAKTGKLIMVDFYTDWCGWCKRLDRDTFPNKTVIKLSQDFVPLKLNAEKEGRRLARRNGVRGYPTILFFEHTGKLVGRIGGYLKPGPFAEAMKRVQASYKKS